MVSTGGAVLRTSDLPRCVREESKQDNRDYQKEALERYWGPPDDLYIC